MALPPSLRRKNKSLKRARKQARQMAKIVTEISFSLISTIMLDPSKASSYLIRENRFQFYLYVAFLVMILTSLPFGLLLSFLSKKETPDSDEMIRVQYKLSCAVVVLVVLALGAGLCVVVPKELTSIVALILLKALHFAYNMNAHVLILNTDDEIETRHIRKANEESQKIARKVICLASTIISTMVLSPSDVFEYVTTMSGFGYYLASIFAVVTFVSLVLGFLLLLLANKNGKSEDMMLVQKRLRVAALVSLILEMATGLGLVVREVLIGVGMVCFFAYVFREKLNLQILI